MYAEVILPLPIPGTFTYRIPDHFCKNVTEGARVIVVLGNRKIFTGIVYRVHNSSPPDIAIKEILDLLDTTPVILPQQFPVLVWIAKYYMCTLGEVVAAALPSGLKISSESYVALNPEIDPDDLELTDRERQIVTHLVSGDQQLFEIGKALGIQSVHHHIRNLTKKNAIHLFEQIRDKYTPRKVTKVRLSEELVTETELDNLSNALEGKAKQLEVLVSYLNLVPVLDSPESNLHGIIKKQLTSSGISPSSLKTLVKNGVFIEWEEIVPRINLETSHEALPQLSPHQEVAKSELRQALQERETVLLHGITGSGKTEIYITLIHEALKSGKQVLYLLPEIALTSQIIKRLARVFGQSFCVYHSRYSDSERVEVWNKVLNGECQLVVGVRSSVFLPFADLSLIIIDEEHEPSYKQYDPAPRYHARDVALYLAAQAGAKTILGSATPSLETYQNASEGKYGLVKLAVRFANATVPKITFSDLKIARKQRKMKGNFSSLLLEKIEEILARSEQVILFQNRRGYAPYITCESCGHIPKCPNCDVSLTYHIHSHFIICHYCGFKTEMPAECPRCNAHVIKTMSFGTEKLEEELEILLPQARIQRMDLDSTRSKYSYQRIIDAFENREVDILLGTQMISKGLDFDQVTLVGIFDTDRMIHFPDFRSHERAYQLIHQVSGRSGRGSKAGEVVIQTSDPTHPILRMLHDYDLFFLSEIAERKKFHYPPFYRLIRITVKHKEVETARQAAQFYSMEIARSLGQMRMIGPVAPLISRIRGMYLFEITLKLEKQGLKMNAIKEFLLNSRNMLLSQRLYKSVKVVFDVDPL